MDNLSAFLDFPDNNISRKSQDFLDSIPSLEVKVLPSTIESNVSTLTSATHNIGPAINFTYNLFLKKPHLFDVRSFSLLYTKFCGVPYPTESVYEFFTQFIQLSNDDKIKLQRLGGLENINNFINPLIFKYDPHIIISWARILNHVQTSIVFEPVMENLNVVLNNWLKNRVVTFDGVNYDINIFKPLCYNGCGENYYELLPYICYLMTFFIHCRPYSFNEEYSHSSSYGFTTALENWFKINYVKFGNDHGINVVSSDYSNLLSISDEHFITLFKHILEPEKIIEIRNEVLNKEETLMDENVADQNGLDEKFVKTAWDQTISNMIEIIVKNTPIKKIYDKFPTFDTEKINVMELMCLTQYCIAGGDTPFCIDNNDSNYSYTIHGDMESIQKYPVIFGTQKLDSKIKTLTISKQRPFTCSDFILECCMAYVKQKFDDKRMDIDDPSPITLDVDILRRKNVKLKQSLINLFVQGLWMYDNSSMVNLLNILLKDGFNINFVEQLTDLMNLDNITSIVYKNRLASIIIVPYLLSYLNSLLLHFCNNKYLLKNFDMFSYLNNSEYMVDRSLKLENMLLALLYIDEISYYEYINFVVNEFAKIIDTSNPIIQVPYIKGVHDMADKYAIGGVEMYNYAAYSNPLVRAYGVYTGIYGNFENLESFYKWISNINNPTALEVINESLKDINVIVPVIRNQLTKIPRPNILKNFMFDIENGTYIENLSPYILNLLDSNDKNLIELLNNYVFQETKTSEIKDHTIVSRQINYLGNGALQALAPVESKMLVLGKTKTSVEYPLKLSTAGITMMLPVYDVKGEVSPQGVIYTNPPGTNLITLTLFNSRIEKNMIVWLFTSMKTHTTFDRYNFTKYIVKDSESVPSTSRGMYIDRISSNIKQ